MDEASVRVRRQVRAARELRGWNQFDLASAAGISRRSVQRLEEGVRLGEGKESKIEAALGWRIGSLDQIRAGGEPSLVESASQDVPPADPEERAIYDSMWPIPHDERMQTVAAAMELRRRHRGTGT